MTLNDLIASLTDLALSIVPAGTIGLIVVAGAVIGGAAALVNRFRRMGK